MATSENTTTNHQFVDEAPINGLCDVCGSSVSFHQNTLGFTPGPWETSRDAVPEGHTQITVHAESIGGRRVATVFECEANARLIAAAPDLLAFVQYVRDFYQDAFDVMPVAFQTVDNEAAALIAALEAN